MGFLIAGLIFLLIAAGFLLNWGYPDAGANDTADIIIGLLFALIGIGLLMYRNPLEGVTQTVTHAAERFIHRDATNETLSRPEEIVNRAKGEAQGAVDEVSEKARKGIHRMAKEISDATADPK